VGRAFSCVLIVIDGTEHVSRPLRAEWEARVLVEVERSIDRLRGSREILFGVDRSRALLAVLGADVSAAGSFAAEVAEHAMEAFDLSPPFGVSIGVASSLAPAAADLDGLFLETLLGVAADGAEVAGVGGAWVHTELYGLVQRRLVSHGFCAPAAERGPLPIHGPRPSDPAPAEAGEGAPRSGGSADGWREIQPRAAAPPRPGDGIQVGEDSPEAGLTRLVLRALEGAGLNRSEASAAQGALLPLLDSFLDAQRARSADESRAHVARLERRISKLKRQLERLEGADLGVHASPGRDGSSGSSGVSSTFREAQGLSPGDRQFELKSDLLGAILKANLELVACSARSSEALREAEGGPA